MCSFQYIVEAYFINDDCSVRYFDTYSEAFQSFEEFKHSDECIKVFLYQKIMEV